MKTNALIICVSFFLLSCPLYMEKTEGENEPPYTANIAWDSGLFIDFSQLHTVDGDSVYFYERPPGYATVNIYTLTRLDAETGRLVWRSPKFSNIVFCQPLVVDNYVYVFLEPNGIVCFDKKTGKHTATAEVDIDNQNLRMDWNVTSYRQYLYMGLWKPKAYFVRLDINSITHVGDPDDIQTVTPEILWQPETGNSVPAKPVVHNGIVYTSTYGGIIDPDPIELAGFDIATGRMAYYQTFGGPADKGLPFPERGGGNASNPIFIYDDVLYYLSWSISAWNLKTGEPLFRHVFTRNIPESQWYNTTRTLQPIYYRGKIYYTGGESYTTPDSFQNIHCIDAATGTLVWNDIAERSVSLWTNPIIAHDRLYVSQHVGLRVYEPENGELIGVDKSFCGASMGRNVLYKDYMICIQMDKNDDGKLVAVYVGK